MAGTSPAMTSATKAQFHWLLLELGSEEPAQRASRRMRPETVLQGSERLGLMVRDGAHTPPHHEGKLPICFGRQAIRHVCHRSAAVVVAMSARSRPRLVGGPAIQGGK